VEDGFALAGIQALQIRRAWGGDGHEADYSNGLYKFTVMRENRL
jgi:hypothetical protein